MYYFQWKCESVKVLIFITSTSSADMYSCVTLIKQIISYENKYTDVIDNLKRFMNARDQRGANLRVLRENNQIF